MKKDVSMDEELARDAANNVTAKPDQLAKIIAAAADLREATNKVKKLEDDLINAKFKQRQLEQEILPALMDEAGVKQLGLDTGDDLMREEDVYASVSQESMPGAVRWLDKHNMGSLVKNLVLVPIDRTNPAMLGKIQLMLTKAKIEFVVNSTIHPQTLKAFAKESVAEGRKLPKEFAVHVQPVVHIKAPKKSKTSSRSK